MINNITIPKNIILHSRIIMAFYVMMSFLLALLLANHKIDFAIFVAFISWLLLTFGANLFNDYFDKDKQALIGLPKPTPVTIEILYAAYFVKALGLLLSIIYLPIYFTLIYIIGVLASIVYSGKKVRIKSKAKTSIFFSLASGSASYFSILIVIYQPNYYLDTRTIIIHLLGMVASGLFLSAFHIITQIHQKKEDESRGDNTLTVMYGKKKALLTAIAFLSLSSLILIYLFWTEVSYIIVVIFIIYSFYTLILLMRWFININESNDLQEMKLVTNYSLNFLFFLVILVYLYYIYLV